MVWRSEQLGRFLDVAASHRMYPLFCLFTYMAFRRSVACGLKWTDTDLAGGKLLVGENTLIQLGAEIVEQDESKTEESRSWVTAPAEVVTPLAACQMQQEEERLEWEDAWNDTGYCFTWEDGKPYDPE
jgi:hypothetical protein